MRLLVRIALALSLLSWPASALTAPPPSVTGIKAVEKNGQIHVEWDAPSNAEEIEFYRIYYSRKSILQNDGAYDEFETTSGDNTEFILTDFPEAEALYISVLAVNEDEEESATFAEEATIGVPESASSSSATPIPATESFTLLRAESIAGTGVLLTFSAAPHLEAVHARSAFQITDASGAVIALRRFKMIGRSILIDTEPQTNGRTYTARIAPVVYGLSPAGERVALDEATSIQNFTGTAAASGTSTPTPVPVPIPEALGTLPDVGNLQLSYGHEGNGFYTIVASWEPPTDPRVTGFRIRTSRDKGKTFAAAQTVAPDSRSFRLSGIPRGDFTFVIQTAGSDGSFSPEVSATVVLTSATDAGKKDLTRTGAEALIAFAAAGSIMGWKRTRKFFV